MFALIIVIAILIVIIILREWKANRNKLTDQIGEIKINVTQEKLPYQKKFLLTKNEWSFYKNLKKITDKHNLHILSKIRLADLVEVKSGLDKKEWATYFSKIKSKHIDFALCNPENLAVLLLIELDDSSHDKENIKERDSFIERVFNDTGYKLLRVRNVIDIETKICEMLSLNREETDKVIDWLLNIFATAPFTLGAFLLL